MARVAILANSMRPDGRCLAGIDLATGEWVRPITRDGDGIPPQRCVIDGRLIRLLDILELDLSRPRTVEEYQKENLFIRNWHWRINHRVRPKTVSQFIDTTDPILHSDNDRVDPRILQGLPSDEWRSLQLVKPRRLVFSRHYWVPNRWVASFSDSKGNSYSLKITDSEATRRLERGVTISKRSLLTVSMTKPWTPDPAKKPSMCYKVVAAVIDLK